MSSLDRDIYLRNYVMGVLVSHSGKGLSYSNIGELAHDITCAVIEADTKWLIENSCKHDPKGDYHECVDRCTKCGVICE